jgi:hypothetical protein
MLRKYPTPAAVYRWRGYGPAMARTRSGFATALAVLGAALLVVGASGLWIQHTLGERDTFTSLADDLIERPEIRTALAETAIEPLFEEAPLALALQRELAVGLIAGLLGDERFVGAFREVLRQAHTRLIERERGPIEITLELVVDVAREDLADISPELAARVDAIETPEIVVVAREEAQALRTLLEFERSFAVGLVIAGAVMVMIAALRNGMRALVASGVAAVVTAAVLFVILIAIRAGVLAGVEAGRAREAAGAAWDVIIAGLLVTLVIAAGAGVAAAVLGIAFSASRRALRVRA